MTREAARCSEGEGREVCQLTASCPRLLAVKRGGETGHRTAPSAQIQVSRAPLVGEEQAVVSECEKGSKSAVVLATGTLRAARSHREALGSLGADKATVRGRKPGRNVCLLEPVCLSHSRRSQVSWSCPNRDNARMNNDGLAAGVGLCEPEQ